jgi:hypothetical protein
VVFTQESAELFGEDVFSIQSELISAHAFVSLKEVEVDILIYEGFKAVYERGLVVNIEFALTHSHLLSLLLIIYNQDRMQAFLAHESESYFDFLRVKRLIRVLAIDNGHINEGLVELS